MPTGPKTKPLEERGTTNIAEQSATVFENEVTFLDYRSIRSAKLRQRLPEYRNLPRRNPHATHNIFLVSVTKIKTISKCPSQGGEEGGKERKPGWTLAFALFLPPRLNSCACRLPPATVPEGTRSVFGFFLLSLSLSLSLLQQYCRTVTHDDDVVLDNDCGRKADPPTDRPRDRLLY